MTTEQSGVKPERLSDRLRRAADGMDCAGDSASSMWLENLAHDALVLEQQRDDLAEALRNMIRYSDDAEWADEQEATAQDATAGNVTYYDALLDKARAALAKVEGAQQS